MSRNMMDYLVQESHFDKYMQSKKDATSREEMLPYVLHPEDSNRQIWYVGKSWEGE